MTNFANLLVEAADRTPNARAVRLDEEVVDYASLLATARRTAALVQAHGLQPGDRVGLVSPNVPAFPIAYFGVLLAGGTVVPMNPLLKAPEMEYYLNDSGARMVLAGGELMEEARKGAEVVGAKFLRLGVVVPDDLPVEGIDLIEREDSDVALLIYTSGTTGHPKGAELTHGNLNFNTRNLV